MEFAESAARMIRENLGGHKKIVLCPNRSRFRECAENITDTQVAGGSAILVYPFSTHSNSVISGLVSREADESQVNELLRTKSVRMEVICPGDEMSRAMQYMISCGGYDIKS